MSHRYFLVLALSVGACWGMNEPITTLFLQVCDINTNVPYDCTIPAWQLVGVNKKLTAKVRSLQKPILRALLNEYIRDEKSNEFSSRIFSRFDSGKSLFPLPFPLSSIFIHQLRWDNRCTSATWLHTFCKNTNCLSADMCDPDKRIPAAWYNAHTANDGSIKIEKLLIPSQLSHAIIAFRTKLESHRATKPDWDGLTIARLDHSNTSDAKHVVSYTVDGKSTFFLSNMCSEPPRAYALQLNTSKTLHPPHPVDYYPYDTYEMFLTIDMKDGQKVSRQSEKFRFVAK